MSVSFGTTDVGNTPIPVTDNAGSLTVDGTVTSNQGTANTSVNGWPVKITDGTTVANIDSSNSSQYVTSVGGTLNNGTLVTVSQVATQLVAANANRKALLIKVISNATIAVGTTGVTATTGFTLAQGDSLMFNEPFCPRNVIFGIRVNNGNVTVLVQEIV